VKRPRFSLKLLLLLTAWGAALLAWRSVVTETRELNELKSRHNLEQEIGRLKKFRPSSPKIAVLQKQLEKLNSN
jgi:hypothetical protein